MKVGLALSGGGTRAVTFHLGVLLRLAHCDVFDRIVRLSTVSGGSLTTALIFTHGKAKPEWPVARDYIQNTYPALRQLLTSVDLLSVQTVLRNPHIMPLVPAHRALAISKLLQTQWGINGSLSELPENPHWMINTTCVETGKNWRFSRSEMGDWVFGKHYEPPYDIATVAAASAAVPYALGGLSFKLPNDGWFETDPGTGKPIKEKEPPLHTVRLWDGGVYENLGIEPLYKPGRNAIDCDDVIVSDASGSIPTLIVKGVFGNLFGGSLITPRLFDISSDQIRSLRSRMFIEAIVGGRTKGSLIRMGNSSSTIFRKAGVHVDEHELPNRLNDNDANKAWNTPTHLRAFHVNQFDLIARHGFECADATLTAHRKDISDRSIPWPNI